MQSDNIRKFTRGDSPVEQQVVPIIRRRKPVIDSRIERQIITGMILNDHFLQQTKQFVNLLQADFSRRVAQWCTEFYDKHKKVPGRHIEDLYLEHKDSMPEDEAALIEGFLAGISEEYERADALALNLDYLLAKAKDYFDLCSIKNLQHDLQIALVNNRPQDARQHILDWVDKTGFKAGDFLEYTVELKEFMMMEIPRHATIINPLIREGTLAMIAAPAGVGKTMLALSLGFAACTCGEVGPWKCENPTGVLYVDAEMSAEEMQADRLRPLKNYFPRVIRPFQLLSNDLLHLKDKPPINLTKQTHRDELYGLLQKREDIGLLVLDNIAAFTPGIDENSKQEWDPINQWLISLRFLGVAVILIHHTGKSGKQRGTSGREDALHVIIKLERPPAYKPEDGCRFIAKFEKARGIYGDNAKPVEFKITQVAEKMIVTALAAREELRRLIVAALGQDYSGKDIATMLKCSQGNITHHKKWAVKQGYLRNDGKFTVEGQRSFGQVKIDFGGGI